MLTALEIANIVLIERLTLAPGVGLNALTGETGAGKSILLDALGLALGARAESGLVRAGAERGQATAAFEPPAGHPVFALLEEQEIEANGELILRRSLGADGRSRAWINDQPVSIGLLRAVGEALVEVHGQHDARGLLNAASHRDILDSFGELDEPLAACREAWRRLAAAREELAEAERVLAAARAEEDWLRHAASELDVLDPQAGEEATLAERRALLQEGERILEAVEEASRVLDGADGALNGLHRAQRALERVAAKAGGRLDEALSALDRTQAELEEAVAAVRRLADSVDLDPRTQDQVEERLFALREAARKHRVSVDELAGLRQRLDERLLALDDGGARVGALQAAFREAETAYGAAAARLSAARQAAAQRLDAAVARELPDLAMDRASFVTRIEPLPEGEGGPAGTDRVGFLVSTIPGSPPGALNRIASGGELSRFMLALKVALSDTRSAGTLIFDEVDAGVGGAVADRVGARLAALAGRSQVLVVTHSPQVAARAGHHWRIAKSEGPAGLVTDVVALDPEDRREEIARMLAGREITGEARAAADSLIAAGRG